MDHFLSWLDDFWESLKYSGLEYSSWAYFVPEFLVKVTYCAPAILRDLLGGRELPGYIDICWRRYTYVRLYYLAGYLAAKVSVQEEMAAGRDVCRKMIEELDDALGSIY